MPPTPWQTEILAPGIRAGAVPRIWRTLSCKAYMPYMPECMYERPPPLVLSGIPGAAGPAGRPRDAGGGVSRGNEGSGLAARHKAEILEAVDRQMRKACPWQRTGGVVDHQMVDVFMRNAGFGKGLGAGDAEGARGGASFVTPAKAGGPRGMPRPLRPWIPAFAGTTDEAHHRRLDTLAGAEEVDRPPVRCQGQALREVASALGRNQDQSAAPIGDETALQ